MALSQAIPDSFNDAKEVFRESLINLPFYERVNHQLIEEILQKHPDLVNCEYKQELLDRIPKLVDLEYKKEMEFYGTPLLLTCEQRGGDEGKFPSCFFQLKLETSHLINKSITDIWY